MKVEVNLDSNLEYERVVIHAKEVSKEVERIVNCINTKNIDYISGSYEGRIYLLDLNDIYYFYAQQQRVYAKTKDQALLVKSKLYELEDMLNNHGFVRISNSVISNVSKIKHIEMSFNGTLSIKFKNNDIEYSSRRYVKKIKEYLGL